MGRTQIGSTKRTQIGSTKWIKSGFTRADGKVPGIRPSLVLEPWDSNANPFRNQSFMRNPVGRPALAPKRSRGGLALTSWCWMPPTDDEVYEPTVVLFAASFSMSKLQILLKPPPASFVRSPP